jgi:hypothetical protein
MPTWPGAAARARTSPSKPLARYAAGVALAALLAAPVRSARAADGPEAAGPMPVRTTDWVGLELSSFSLNLGSPSGRFAGAPPPQRYSLAPGATLRAFVLRWPSWYWTPLQFSGVFGRHLSSGDASGARTILLALQTEAGRIVKLGDHARIELGLAAGIGGLGIEFSSDCDASCEIGGAGVMLSPVVRLARGAVVGNVATSVGLFARAQVPLQARAFLAPNSGYGVLFLFGVDAALGARP